MIALSEAKVVKKMNNMGTPHREVIFEESLGRANLQTQGVSRDGTTVFSGGGGVISGAIYTMTIPLTRLSSNGLIFEVDAPLSVVVTYKGGYVQMDCTALSLYSAGKDLEEATESFAEDFAFTWREYAEEEDANLSGDARKLKSWLLNHVRITV